MARNGAEIIQARVNALSAQAKAAAAAVAAGAIPDSPTPDADARIIGAALQPLTPSAPRVGLIIALGGILGLTSGFLAVALASALDRSIRTPEDLTRATGLACLATVPEVSRGTGLSRAFAAAIRDLRTSIMVAYSSKRREGNFAVALVSWAPEAGCTLLCTNLAHMISEER